MATNGAPFCDRVIRRVARAIEGAAPNRPAKLLGRKVSPSAAKAETAIPPQGTSIRIQASLPLVGTIRQLMALSRGVSSALSALRRKTTSWIFAMPNFITLPPFTEDGDVHVVVETPAGAEPNLNTTRNSKPSFYRNRFSRD